MSNIQFSLVTSETGQRFVTVYADGKLTAPAPDDHPNFKAIVAACQANFNGDPVDAQEVLDLFDIPATISRKFERLSRRVSVEGTSLLFDGDPVEDGLSKQILRFLDEGEDVEPLVNFMEKINANPNDHSKVQAWDWLNNHDFTITEDGDVIGYKGVYDDGQGGYRSGHRGNAIRNGQRVENDYVPNAPGDVIEMPRSEVAHDPSQACHRGLHVGTFAYAKSYAQGAMLRVLINPADIVSVPTDAGGAKIRVCRYEVDEVIIAPETKALYRSDDFEDDDSRDLDESAVLDSQGKPISVGDDVEDFDEDSGTVVSIDENGYVLVKYDNAAFGTVALDPSADVIVV